MNKDSDNIKTSTDQHTDNANHSNVNKNNMVTTDNDTDE